MGELTSDLTDVKGTHEALHTFVDWDSSLTSRRKVSPYDINSVVFEKFPHELGYHGTYMRNFVDIVRYGLVSGGSARHESGSRAFCHDGQRPCMAQTGQRWPARAS